MFNILIKNGFVIDGTGSPWFKADVGVRDGKIVEICKNLPSSQADRIIDANGLVVCPGFIDMHAHSELTYFVHPEAEAKIMQGVTTEVNCNCGNSGSGPLIGPAVDQIKKKAQAQSLFQSIRNLINCPIVSLILSNKSDWMKLKRCHTNY